MKEVVKKNSSPAAGPEHRPRITNSPDRAPIFKQLPIEIHPALTGSRLTAWMDKNLQYPIAKYLPVGAPLYAYTPRRTHGDFGGGNVWDAARQFRDAGVAPELARRLQEWGIAFTNREARLQYH